METRPRAPCIICGEDIARFSFSKGNFHIYQCTRCALRFVWPQPAGEAVASLYGTDYFSGAREGFGYVDYDTDKAAMKKTFGRYLDLMGGACAATGALLDVGAATGYFLSLARDRGWRTSGVEISPYAAAHARKKGFDVQTGTLETAAFSPASFSAITVWDVIEHVADPSTLLSRMHSLLLPNGMIALSTPDVGSMVARVLGKRWHAYVPPEHLWYFSGSTMRRLLERNGFSDITVRKIGKRFTLAYMAKTLATTHPSRFAALMASFIQKTGLGAIVIPFNLRDNIFVTARKSAISARI